MPSNDSHSQAVRVLAAAFLDDPVLSWAFPERPDQPDPVLIPHLGRLAECDAAGLPAYLEASSPRNISLYARHGSPIRWPDGPELFPLWREPAPMIIHRTESRP